MIYDMMLQECTLGHTIRVDANCGKPQQVYWCALVMKLQWLDLLLTIPMVNFMQAYAIVMTHYNMKDIVNSTSENLLRKVKALPLSVATAIFSHFHESIQ